MVLDLCLSVGMPVAIRRNIFTRDGSRQIAAAAGSVLLIEAIDRLPNGEYSIRVAGVDENITEVKTDHWVCQQGKHYLNFGLAGSV